MKYYYDKESGDEYLVEWLDDLMLYVSWEDIIDDYYEMDEKTYEEECNQ